jgi:DNA-directed RNA polymerase subunit K/omega
MNTRPYISKYEKTLLIGTRITQLCNSAVSLVDYKSTPQEIALEELYLSTKKTDPVEQKYCNNKMVELYLKHNNLKKLPKDMNVKSVFPLILIRNTTKKEYWHVYDMFDVDDENLGDFTF